MKRIFILCISASIYLHAGFWSDVVSTAIGTSLVNGNSKNSSQYKENAVTKEKKVQQVLTKLGFYGTKIDGNLNSFESRTAIEKFQHHYKSNIVKDWKDKLKSFISSDEETTGILTEKEISDILYIHDLFKQYRIEYNSMESQYKPIYSNFDRLNQIYNALDKAEEQFVNGKKLNKYISAGLKENFDEKNQEISKIKQIKKDWFEKHDTKNIVASYERKLLWSDYVRMKSKKLTWNEAFEHCKNLSLDGFKIWRLPTISELSRLELDLKYKDLTFKNLHIQKSSSKKKIIGLSHFREYWSSQNTTTYNAFLETSNSKSKTSRYNVICVKDAK